MADQSVWRARAKAEGRYKRDLEKEAAARRGLSVKELRLWREERAENKADRVAAKESRARIAAVMIHDAHIRAYRKSTEYQRRKSKEYYYRVDSNGKRLGCSKVERMSDGWIASKIGLPLSILPTPLLELKRQIIRAKRVCHEIQQH